MLSARRKEYAVVYLGVNVPHLRAVKATVDPDNVISFAALEVPDIYIIQLM